MFVSSASNMIAKNKASFEEQKYCFPLEEGDQVSKMQKRETQTHESLLPYFKGRTENRDVIRELGYGTDCETQCLGTCLTGQEARKGTGSPFTYIIYITE